MRIFVETRVSLNAEDDPLKSSIIQALDRKQLDVALTLCGDLSKEDKKDWTQAISLLLDRRHEALIDHCLVHGIVSKEWLRFLEVQYFSYYTNMELARYAFKLSRIIQSIPSKDIADGKHKESGDTRFEALKSVAHQYYQFFTGLWCWKIGDRQIELVVDLFKLDDMLDHSQRIGCLLSFIDDFYQYCWPKICKRYGYDDMLPLLNILANHRVIRSDALFDYMNRKGKRICAANRLNLLSCSVDAVKQNIHLIKLVKYSLAALIKLRDYDSALNGTRNFIGIAIIDRFWVAYTQAKAKNDEQGFVNLVFRLIPSVFTSSDVIAVAASLVSKKRIVYPSYLLRQYARHSNESAQLYNEIADLAVQQTRRVLGDAYTDVLVSLYERIEGLKSCKQNLAGHNHNICSLIKDLNQVFNLCFRNYCQRDYADQQILRRPDSDFTFPIMVSDTDGGFVEGLRRYICDELKLAVNTQSAVFTYLLTLQPGKSRYYNPLRLLREHSHSTMNDESTSLLSKSLFNHSSDMYRKLRCVLDILNEVMIKFAKPNTNLCTVRISLLSRYLDDAPQRVAPHNNQNSEAGVLSAQASPRNELSDLDKLHLAASGPVVVNYQ